MRQIEKMMVQVVNEKRNFKSGNTQVVADQKGVAVYLHGNCIAVYRPNGERVFTLAGWNTTTTRSRLNALGVKVCQRNYEAWYNGRRISERGFYNF